MQEYSLSLSITCLGAISPLEMVPFAFAYSSLGAFSPLEMVPFAFASMEFVVETVFGVLVMLEVAAGVAMGELSGVDVGVPTSLYTDAAAAA